MKRQLSTLAVVVLVFLAPARGRAEVLDEFWPELDLWYSFSKSTRALLTVAGGRSREDGDRADAEMALYLDYRASKRISYRVGYLQTIDSSSEDEGAGEQRALFDFNYRWHFGSSTELADRTRLELRDLGDEDSVRIRNRLRVQSERQVRQVSVSPYASLEAYYDDRYHSVSRWRVETGFTMPSGRHLEWDFYLGWQQDRRPESDSLTGLGITLNVK